MPLEVGSSKQTISRNVDIMIREYRRTGKIGDTHPTSLQDAYKIASAIAHDKAGG